MTCEWPTVPSAGCAELVVPGWHVLAVMFPALCVHCTSLAVTAPHRVNRPSWHGEGLFATNGRSLLADRCNHLTCCGTLLLPGTHTTNLWFSSDNMLQEPHHHQSLTLRRSKSTHQHTGRYTATHTDSKAQPEVPCTRQRAEHAARHHTTDCC